METRTLLCEVDGWRRKIEAGRTPAELVSSSSTFPDVFQNLYSTGEISGRLDESLVRLRQYYYEEGTRNLRLVAAWFPRIVYMAVALLIAYRVVSFWSGYFRQIGEIIPG